MADLSTIFFRRFHYATPLSLRHFFAITFSSSTNAFIFLHQHVIYRLLPLLRYAILLLVDAIITLLMPRT